MGFPCTGAFPLHGKQQDVFENLSGGSRPGRLAMPVIKALLGLTIPMLMGAFGSAAAPLSRSSAKSGGAQGWSGWYPTNATYPGTPSGDVPTFILFGGPYSMENGGLEV
jgi:hypothetical protein